MERLKYIPNQEEIKFLLYAIERLGPKETCIRLKEKTAAEINKGLQADEMCMDMHEFILNAARVFDANNEENEKTKNNLFLLASMFRYLAHQFHKIDKEGKANRRFLELVSYNSSASTYMHK